MIDVFFNLKIFLRFFLLEALFLFFDFKTLSNSVCHRVYKQRLYSGIALKSDLQIKSRESFQVGHKVKRFDFFW